MRTRRLGASTGLGVHASARQRLDRWQSRPPARARRHRRPPPTARAVESGGRHGVAGRARLSRSAAARACRWGSGHRRRRLRGPTHPRRQQRLGFRGDGSHCQGARPPSKVRPGRCAGMWSSLPVCREASVAASAPALEATVPQAFARPASRSAASQSSWTPQRRRPMPRWPFSSMTSATRSPSASMSWRLSSSSARPPQRPAQSGHRPRP